MGTPAERKALLFLALVAILGAAVRAIGAPAGKNTTDPEARRALREQMNAVEAARRAQKQGSPGGRRAPSPRTERASSRSSVSRAPATSPAAATPLRAIDVDAASAAELELLPGIGPSLAFRIVEDRNLNGPFGSIVGLQRVKGIGPALSNRLTPHVTFSGTPRPTSADLGGRSRATGAGKSAASSGRPRPVGRMSIPP